MDQMYTQAGASSSKKEAFPQYSAQTSNYYAFDSATKTAYIGWDEFESDYIGWDKYYNGKGDVPVKTDTYAFVREKFYQAKKDGVENLVLDISTNGGGDTYSLAGVISLLNKGKAYYHTLDTFNNVLTTENYLVDINLDGRFDESDAYEAEQFNFNIGVLTSGYSFSCANLFPQIAKELGYKIIGHKSGGGSCAIALQTTPDGLPYVQSSYITLVDKNGEDVDDGVWTDYQIPTTPLTEKLSDYSNFYDFEVVANYLKTAY